MSPLLQRPKVQGCVCQRDEAKAAPIHHSGDVEMLHRGLTQGDGPRLTGGVEERPSVKGGGQ